MINSCYSCKQTLKGSQILLQLSPEHDLDGITAGLESAVINAMNAEDQSPANLRDITDIIKRVETCIQTNLVGCFLL